MSTEQTEAPQWGAPTPPPPSRRKWTVRRTVAAVAIAVGIAAAGGVAIYAASGSVTANHGPDGGQGRMVIGGPMGTMEGVDHGEFQSGEVTAVSDTSITAKSEDGYTRTYTVDGDTMKSGDIAKGDDVTIIADADGVAQSVVEEGAMGPRRGGAPPNGGSPPDGDGN